VLDEFDWGLALEGDSEDISQFKDEELLSSGVSVQELFAYSGVISVGLNH
jgi:hypothetical protein